MKKIVLLAAAALSISVHASASTPQALPKYESASLFQNLSTLQTEGMIEAKLSVKVINGDRIETITTNRVSCTHTETSSADENGVSDDYNCSKI